MTDPWEPKGRDHIAYWLARAAMKLASKEYQAFVNVCSNLGLQELMKEAQSKGNK